VRLCVAHKTLHTLRHTPLEQKVATFVAGGPRGCYVSSMQTSTGRRLPWCGFVTRAPLRALITALLLLIAGNAMLAAHAAAQGKVDVTFTTNTRGGKYAPKHVLAVWVETSNGTFAKTLGKWANSRVRYLLNWNAASGKATDVDTVTGASLSSHATRKLSWSLAGVPNGTYKIKMELTEDNATSTAQCNEGSFTVNHNGTSSTQSGLSNGGFTNVSIVYTSDVVVPACGDSSCNGAETCSTCPADCGACAPVCGDKTCNGTETCTSCAGDCGVCPPKCGDSTCNGSETCTSCPGDCGACPASCGDGACGGAESCSNCPGDCGACPVSCGDAVCNGNETCSSCTTDCGMCPPSCGDGSCNGAETCSTCAADCNACPAECGDSSCNGLESCTSCEDDCGACPASCGDATCDSDETCSNCADDCGLCPPECGDARCEDPEDCESCLSDCGECAVTAPDASVVGGDGGVGNGDASTHPAVGTVENGPVQSAVGGFCAVSAPGSSAAFAPALFVGGALMFFARRRRRRGC
jgi:hypothetical protein